MRLVPEGTVDLWIASPPSLEQDAAWPELFGLLTDEDRAKHARYRFERNRHEYATTRVLARVALASYLGAEPRELSFARTPLGRPFLVPEGTMRWNLSNHPTLVVCAVTDRAEVGADVEPLSRGPDILTVATTCFSPEELAGLAALSDAARELRAVSLWTSKEAYLKARGMGLSMPLPHITLRFAAPDAPTLALTPPVDDDPARWTLRIVDVQGHRVALCVEGPLANVRIRTLGPLPRS